MKIITVNIRRTLKLGAIICKAAAFITVFSLSIYISSFVFKNSDYHQEALAQITEDNVIIIDAGHGGEDPGAIGVTGVYEKNLNLEIATELGNLLSDNGFAVIYTRTEDKLLYSEDENIKGLRKFYDLKNRCKIGANYPGAIFISIHMNSYSDEKYAGLQTYYSLKNASSSALAAFVQNSVRNNLQPQNRRQIKPGNKMNLMENLDNPSILIECGFLTNEEECKKLSEKEYQKQLCFSIVCAIIEYKGSLV